MKFVIKFIALAVLIELTYAQNACTTPDSQSGQCISIYDCKPLLVLVRNRNRTSAETKLLRDSHCGFADKTPLVCCPQVETSTDKRCFTPDAKEGTCVSIYSCPHLMKMLQSRDIKANVDFVQNSKCEGPDQYSVCCGPEPTETPKPSRVCSMSSAPPDPRTECCGLDNFSGNKIFGGNATAIDQYPWLTIIEYRGVKDDKIILLCGGVLISGKYVLTAGHCVVGPVLKVGTPINVRLGEYDTSQSGPDCVDSEGGGLDCTDGAKIVPIEKTIPHPQYNPDSKLRRHDIALIRLTVIETYSDFIRPICLPTSDITQESPKANLYVAGWGAVSENESSSNVKLHVGLPLSPMQECQQSYNTSSRKLALWNGQLCAGGEKGKDSCRGDSGGPLMFDNGRIHFIVGVVSFGPTPCGIENIPGVYTKVYQYLPWIRTNVKP